MAESSIEWTDATWNPGFGVTLHPDKLGEPFRWQRPRMVFVNSMSDLFHEEIPDGYIAWVFYVMAQNPQHTFQVLTKRPERMRDFVTRWADNLERDENGEPVGLDFVGARGPDAVREVHKCGRALLFADMLEQWGEPPKGAVYPTYDWMEGIGRYPSVHPNIWLGVTIENRRFVHRADLLRATPAAVRFVSAEPLLGALMPPWSSGMWSPRADGSHDAYEGPGLGLAGIDWLIAGGESGPGARPCDEQWLRDLRDACARSGTAYFLKQLGGHPDKRGHDKAVLDGRLHHEMPRGAARG